MNALRVLHVDDSADDIRLVRLELEREGIATDVVPVATREAFLAEVERQTPDLIFVDHGLPGFGGDAALDLAAERCPQVPFIVVSGSLGLPRPGVTDFVPKSELWRLPAAVRRACEQDAKMAGWLRSSRRLVDAVQALSQAEDLAAVTSVVRKAARDLAGADGATFVLRDGDTCHYVDEDAVGPLWKGRRFPLTTCISGWVMLNRQPAVIRDIYVDRRIPLDVYKTTFVRSLVMMPIRGDAPVGAIGVYWARRHVPLPEEIDFLQALANAAAAALEHVRVIAGLQRQLREQARQLQMANEEIDAFSYVVSHDLQEPLRRIASQAVFLARELEGAPSPKSAECVVRIKAVVTQMSRLTEALFRLAKFARMELRRDRVDVTAFAAEILQRLTAGSPERLVETHIAGGLVLDGDPGMFRIVMENLLTNAWKFTAPRKCARIEVGLVPGTRFFFVRDNGVGFPMEEAGRLFTPFQRLHPASQFPGNGVGLATVLRILHRHGGRIWAEAEPDAGATFFFTLDPEEPAGGGVSG